MMSYLFLDCDGVINRCGMTPKANLGIDHDKIEQVRRIITLTGCRIILSSTWRKFEHLIAQLAREIPLHGFTPVLDSERQLEGGASIWTSATRGQEIQAWLDANPDVTHFVILDDDNDMGPLLPHLVSTQSYTGLTPEIAGEVIRRLNKL